MSGFLYSSVVFILFDNELIKVSQEFDRFYGIMNDLVNDKTRISLNRKFSRFLNCMIK